MDFILDILAHRIGVYVLSLLSGGRFKGVSGFAWGCAVAVGGLIILASLAALITAFMYSNLHVAGIP